MSKNTRTPVAIQSGIGEGFFARLFGGKSFIHCMVEILKNCRDWGATVVHVETADRSVVKIVDNGKGMSAANRQAFLSVNMTTAGAGQSGQFCTGTKQMLYSHTREVTVVTAPEEEPDKVYRFRFTTESYEKLALSRGMLKPEVMPKTPETWPYDFPTGTEITYTLQNPVARTIKRGEVLAREFSARLPLKFQDVVLVDGDPLPPKELVGEIFEVTVEHPHLGGVRVELYRPAKKRAEEDLRVTGAEIGEAPVSTLHRVLAEYRTRFPKLYLLSEVCGTLAVDYLREYAMEDRATIHASVADDPRTMHLIAFLEQIEPEVKQKLQIRMESASEDVDRELDEVRHMFNRIYDPAKQGPLKGSGDNTPPGGGTTGPTGPGQTSTVHLRVIGKEFEPGEQIEVHARVASDKGVIGDLQWLTSRSRAVNVEKTPRGITMTAQTLGTGTVRADLTGTKHSDVVSYQVIPQRIFRLSTPALTVPVGAEVRIRALNADKLSGEVGWSLLGSGSHEVSDEGDSILYRATQAGRAVLTGYDTKNLDLRATCEIEILGRMDTLCVRGVLFLCDTYEAMDSADYAKPVTMSLGGDGTHNLTYNLEAPGFRYAMEHGNLPSFLGMAVAQEFARFHLMELDPTMDLETFHPGDLPMLIQQVQNMGYEIFEEVLTGQTKS